MDHEFSNFHEQFENALCFKLFPLKQNSMIPRNLAEQAQVRMLVADKLKVKHLAFDMMNK